MKCFEIIGTDVIPGLPITWGDGRPYVLIGRRVRWQNFLQSWTEDVGQKAFLSDRLVEQLSAAGAIRIINCDVSIGEDGTVELLPEADDTPASVLVCFAQVGGLKNVKFDVQDGAVLADVDTSVFAHYSVDRGRAVLATVARGGSLQARLCWDETVPGTQRTLFHPFRRPRRQEASQVVAMATANDTGTAISLAG